MTDTSISQESLETADQLLIDFIQGKALPEHKPIQFTPTVMEAQCPVVNGGIVVTDKPLIQLHVSFKD